MPSTTEPPLDTHAAALALVIQDIKAQHPTLPILLPSDPSFAALAACYIMVPGEVVTTTTTAPTCLALARPRSAAEVGAVVAACAARRLPIVVRAGAHDTAGRTRVPGALAIDLREICHVHVDEDEDDGVGGGASLGISEHEHEQQQKKHQRTARVGGGCLIAGVLAELERHGLATPVGTISTVGYVGWAYVGGYGPLSSLFGPGVDQIVGATLVTAAGEVVEADGALLRGVRGAAGALGVVVEVTVKVYPLGRILAGTLVWPTGDNHEAFVENFLQNLQQLYTEGLPPALNPLFSVWNHPHFSRCVVMMATWAADASDADDDATDDEGRRWLARLDALAAPLAPRPTATTVRACTLLEGLRANDATVSPRVYGRCHTATLRGAGLGRAGFVRALAAHTARPGAVGVGVCLHRLVGPGATATTTAGEGEGEGEGDSVWGPRREHTVMEIVSTTTDEGAVEAAWAWACGLRRAVVEAVPEEVLEGGWLAMMPEEEVDLEKVFGGENYRFLLELKRKWDPDNVFKYTVPRLPV